MKSTRQIYEMLRDNGIKADVLNYNYVAFVKCYDGRQTCKAKELLESFIKNSFYVTSYK